MTRSGKKLEQHPLAAGAGHDRKLLQSRSSSAQPTDGCRWWLVSLALSQCTPSMATLGSQLTGKQDVFAKVRN